MNDQSDGGAGVATAAGGEKATRHPKQKNLAKRSCLVCSTEFEPARFTSGTVQSRVVERAAAAPGDTES
jgi:hypothetical protein